MVKNHGRKLPSTFSGPTRPGIGSLPPIAPPQIRADPETHNAVVLGLFGMAKDRRTVAAPAPSGLPSAEAAREAGSKLALNMDAILGDVMKNSGVRGGANQRRKMSVER